MKKPYVKVFLHNLSTDLSATLSTELWINLGRYPSGGTHKNRRLQRRPDNYDEANPCPETGCSLEIDLFGEAELDRILFATFLSGFGIISDRAGPVKGFRHQF